MLYYATDADNAAHIDGFWKGATAIWRLGSCIFGIPVVAYINRIFSQIHEFWHAIVIIGFAGWIGTGLWPVASVALGARGQKSLDGLAA